jgi:hypothetical protein
MEFTGYWIGGFSTRGGPGGRHFGKSLSDTDRTYAPPAAFVSGVPEEPPYPDSGV